MVTNHLLTGMIFQVGLFWWGGSGSQTSFLRAAIGCGTLELRNWKMDDGSIGTNGICVPTYF